MKTLFLSLLFIVPFTIGGPPADNVLINIRVGDESGIPLVGVNVKITSETDFNREGITDINGKVSFSVPEGIYHILVTYSGYESQKQENVSVFNEETNLTIYLKKGTALEEVVVTGYEETKHKRVTDGTLSSFTPDAISTTRMERSTMSEVSGVSAASPGYSTTRTVARNTPLPEAGQITAGEWNDLYNWKDWIALLEDDGFQTMEEYWNIHSRKRYSVLVMNKNELPLSGVLVKLLNNKGSVLWQTHTDVSGRAEVWEGVYDMTESASRIEIIYQGKKKVSRELISIERGSNIARFDTDCQQSRKADIAIVVDATSSMSDEIQYLQSELLDVITRVQTDDLDISWASLFYRDHSDEYVTKPMEFSDDARDILAFIEEQSASGGGDFPEAVSDAVSVAVNDLSWRDDADTKLMFLLLDAPPHADQSSMKIYKDAVRTAAQKGIKIIPITASGINRETEFLMKFTAMLTNGTYVFITDDSGIGNPHLDPVVEDYEVEKLNDLLVRLIQSFTNRPECEVQQEILQVLDYKIYPNPATDILNVENVSPGDVVIMISSSGKIVKKVIVNKEETIQIQIHDLISGTYVLRIQRGQDSVDKRVMVIK